MTDISRTIPTHSAAPAATAATAATETRPTPGVGDVVQADVSLRQGREGYLLELAEPMSVEMADGATRSVSYLLMDADMQAAMARAVDSGELERNATVEDFPLEIVSVTHHEVTVGIPKA
jgi:hypothetical protein